MGQYVSPRAHTLSGRSHALPAHFYMPRRPESSLENIEIVVIGKPLKLNNEIHDLEEEIVKFIKSLKNHLPNIQVERIDERFTSKISKQIIIKSGVGKKNRRDKLIIDKISASLILESYLIQKNK